jgi:hypothetical protein
MSADTSVWRKVEEEARIAAGRMTDPEPKRTMLFIAEGYSADLRKIDGRARSLAYAVRQRTGIWAPLATSSENRVALVIGWFQDLPSLNQLERSHRGVDLAACQDVLL